MSFKTLLGRLILLAAPALLAPAAFAQTPGTAKPAAPKPAATAPKPAAAAPAGLGGGRVAIINTSAFQDPQSGITRLAAAFGKVSAEFEPKRQEMVAMQTKMTALQTEISAFTDATDAAVRKAKTDEMEAMRQDFQKKNEEAQGSYQKRMEESVSPLFTDIGTAMEAYAKKIGVAALLDTAKLRDAVYVVSDQIDITKGFIADYNKTHPGTAPAAPTAPPSQP